MGTQLQNIYLHLQVQLDAGSWSAAKSVSASSRSKQSLAVHRFTYLLLSVVDLLCLFSLFLWLWLLGAVLLFSSASGSVFSITDVLSLDWSAELLSVFCLLDLPLSCLTMTGGGGAWLLNCLFLSPFKYAMYFLYSSGVKKPITKIIKHNNTLLYYSAEKNTSNQSYLV